jgi:hypothetical protein
MSSNLCNLVGKLFYLEKNVCHFELSVNGINETSCLPRTGEQTEVNWLRKEKEK